MNKQASRVISLLLMLSLLLSLPLSAVEATTAPAESEPAVTTPSPPSQTDPETSLPPMTKVEAGGVINGRSGEMLYSLNESRKMPPAAAAKLMTALLVIEHFGEETDTVIEITADALAGGSGVGANLKEGERLTVRQLLACLVVGSANDAAVVLARTISGSTDAFVARMNERAAELGMKDTVYRNPTGLHHDAMVTTVKDTLLLASLLYQRDEFVNLASREAFEIEQTETNRAHLIHNRNYLVSDELVSDYYDPNIDGMCYGSTYEAGGVCVASYPTSDTVYLAVVFGGETEKIVTESYETTDEAGNVIVVPESERYIAHAFHEVRSLLVWAKDSFAYHRILSTADAVLQIPVKLGSGRNHIALFPSKEVRLFLPLGTDPTAELTLTPVLSAEELVAPVSAGTVAGSLTIRYQGQTVATVDLVTRSTVDRSLLDYYAEQVGAFLSSSAFHRWAAIFVAILAAYALCMSVWRHQSRRKAIRRRHNEQLSARREQEKKELERFK